MSINPSALNKKLAEAVDSFDFLTASSLCNDLIAHLFERDGAYPYQHARRVLKQLRKGRYFDLMETVADALIQNGQGHAEMLRQYAQSQLDKGNLTAAISVLDDLKHTSDAKGKSPNAEENAEAIGLLGRAYKDLYIKGANPGLSKNRIHLQKAIDYYMSIYEQDKSKIWQGINSVALILRASKDRVELDNIHNLQLKAKSIAAEIKGEVESKYTDSNAKRWDFATGIEACVALDEDDEALVWLQRYLESDFLSAFELGSTYRQLTKVWRLNTAEMPGSKILPALKAKLLEQKGSEIEISFLEAKEENLKDLVRDKGYEKVLGSESFKSVKWFHECMQRAGSVAKITNSYNFPKGTAFVIRGEDLKKGLGDELLLLTNAHVVNDAGASRALKSEKAIVRFEMPVENSKDEGQEYTVTQLWTSLPDELDATLLRPEPPIKDRKPVPIARELPSVDEYARAYIIGHPNGNTLAFSIHDNFILDYDDQFLHYRSPTENGSSGSPVFNSSWELIGLHHAGLEEMQMLNNKEETYPANEGIWIQAIIELLAQSDIGTS